MLWLVYGCCTKCIKLLLFAPHFGFVILRRLRYATPLEEGKLSWRVRPSGLDKGLAQGIPHNYQRLIAPYLDADKDEAEADQHVVARRERRKALRAEVGIKRTKK